MNDKSSVKNKAGKFNTSKSCEAKNIKIIAQARPA